MTITTGGKCERCNGLGAVFSGFQTSVCRTCGGGGVNCRTWNALSPVPPPGVMTDKLPERELVLTGEGVRVQVRGMRGDGWYNLGAVPAVERMMDAHMTVRVELDGEEVPGRFIIVSVEVRPMDGRWNLEVRQVQVPEEVVT